DDRIFQGRRGELCGQKRNRIHLSAETVIGPDFYGHLSMATLGDRYRRFIEQQLCRHCLPSNCWLLADGPPEDHGGSPIGLFQLKVEYSRTAYQSASQLGGRHASVPPPKSDRRS